MTSTTEPGERDDCVIDWSSSQSIMLQVSGVTLNTKSKHQEAKRIFVLPHKQLVKCLLSGGQTGSNGGLAAWPEALDDREELSQKKTAVRRSYVTNAVQPLCISQFAIFLMYGVRMCVEEGGLPGGPLV